MNIIYHFQNQEIKVNANPSLSISKNAAMNGIKFSKTETCHGKGTCGLCKMKFNGKLQLGCQSKPTEGMVVEIPQCN